MSYVQIIGPLNVSVRLLKVPGLIPLLVNFIGREGTESNRPSEIENGKDIKYTTQGQSDPYLTL